MLLRVMKESFSELKLKEVYEMLIMMPKLEAKELELTLIQDDEEEELENEEMSQLRK